MKKAKLVLRNIAYQFVRAILLLLIHLAFRPKIAYASEKARQLAFNEPRVLVCNHVRGWDGAVIYSLISRQPVVALVAKDTMEGNLLLRLLLNLLPTLPIDRINASLSWLRGSRQLLKDGKHVMIFPEGKCQFDRVMKPFKPGCVLLAATAGASMLPIYHNGTYHFFFGRRFRMIIGEPIQVTPPPDGIQPPEMERQADALFHIFHQLERQLTGTVRSLPAQKEV